MFQVFQALIYLHDELNVAHRDIKVRHSPFSEVHITRQIKIADFILVFQHLGNA